MYAEFFGLTQDPFSIAPDPRYLFMSERHREALAHLIYGVRAGGGFVLLSGEIGAGKTTVCRCFLEQVPTGVRVAYVFNPRLTVGDLLRTICREFNLSVRHEGLGPATIKDHLDPLNEYLLASHARGERNVLVIDEAQSLSPHVLEQLRLLTNLETNERKLLQIILIGQPELRAVLARPELEQLAQRVIARYHLSALDAAETRQYIEHRLAVAGLKGPVPFSGAALDRVHQLSRGVPRRINLLCDRALLGAYSRGQARVERGVVDKAAAEVFDTEAPALPAPWRAAGPGVGHPQRFGWGALGVGALAGALVGAAALAMGWWWWQRPAPTAQARAPAVGTIPAPAPAPATAPIATATATLAERADMPPELSSSTLSTAAPVPSPPFAGWPDRAALLGSEAQAWQALAALWGTPLTGSDPCTTALADGLQCYRTDRMTLDGLRQLDRPAALLLRLPDGSRGRLLLRGLDDATAVLASGEQRWRVPRAELQAAWGGDYATLWRLPPGQRTRLVDGRTGLAGQWLDERLSALQSAGQLPAGPHGAGDATTRLQRFQRAHGVESGGSAGPITFMQVNRVSGVDEPRLASPS